MSLLMSGSKNQQKSKQSRSLPFNSNNSNSLNKKNNQMKGNRLLISINVPGSAGPLRFLVNEEQLVAAVIDTALRSYAREGRLPLLGTDLNNFLLYRANAGSDALSPWEPIGGFGSRNFILCKKQQQQIMGSSEERRASNKVGGTWKAWLNKSFNFKVYSH